MGYPSKAVANHILDIAGQHKTPVSPLKLLKLVYFAHGWHLALRKDGLINESVEAWKFGPVVPSVYHAFKEFGNCPITEHASELDMAAWQSNRKLRYVEPCLPSDHDLEGFFNKIWEVYGNLSAEQLSALTHQADTPWYKTWFDSGGQYKKGVDIPDSLIREYFEEKAKD